MTDTEKREHKLAVRKAYTLRNIDRIRAVRRAWNLKHKDKADAYSKASKIRHKDKVLARQHDWYVKNRERLVQRQRQYYKDKSADPTWYARCLESSRISKRRHKARRSYSQGVRRARIIGSTVDSTAALFYQFVRSRKKINCYYCGKLISGRNAHVDHIISIKKLGNHCSSNLCASCPECNLKKHSRTPAEWSATPQMLFNI